MTSNQELELSEIACCRVCRVKGSEDSPLFYPCRCSGSIKYVHQECLVEWLKLSKKTYCELCHHKFSFTPIYREGMPKKLPWFLVLASVTRRALKAFGALSSKLILSVLWFVVLPFVSGYVFDVYFDVYGEFIGEEVVSILGELSRGVIAYNIGLVLQVLIVGTFMSLMLLRDYIICTADADEDAQTEKKRSLAKRAKAREAANTGIATLDSSGDQPPMDALSNTMNIKPSLQSDGVRPAIISRRRIEVGKDVSTPQESTINAKSDGRWINQITNREYRAFLKRREILRQREKAQLADGYTSEWEEHVEDNRHDENFDDDLESIHSESLISGGTTSRASTKRSGASELRRRNIIKMDFANSPIRCKICSSNYCVDREHVVQASQISINSQYTTEEPTVIERQAPLQPIPRPKNPIFNFCLYLEHDADEAVDSLKSALGYTSGIKRGVLNWLLALAASLLFFHTFVYGPFFLGRFVFGGLAFQKLSAICDFLFASAFENIARLLSGYRASAYVSDWASKIALGYGYVDEIANYSRWTLLFGGHLVSYALGSALNGGRIIDYSEKSMAIFYAHQWLSFSLNLQKIALFGTLELFLSPAIIFGVAALHAKLLFDTSAFDEVLKRYLIATTVLCIFGGFVLKKLSAIGFEKLKSSLRSGALFFVYMCLPEAKVLTRRILDDSISINLARQLFKLITCLLMVESVIGAPCLILKRILGCSPRPFTFTIEEFEENALYVIVTVATYTALLVSQSNLFLKMALDIEKRLIKYLRLRSICYGGRFVPDESVMKRGAGVWIFAPDQDKSYKWARIRKMASVEVEPIDIARLSIKENQKAKADYDEQTAAAREGASRFKGYSVVFCPSFVGFRLLAVATASFFMFQTYVLFVFLAPLKLGEKLIGLVPSLEVNGTMVKFLPVQEYQLGLLALSLFGFVFSKVYDVSSIEKFENYVSSGINICKRLICTGLLFLVMPALIGTWLHLVASPLIAPDDELPLGTPFSIIASGLFGLYLVLFCRFAVDKQFQDYVSDELSLKSFSMFAFVRHVLLPVMVPLLVSIALPSLSVLLVAPVVDMDAASIITAQKKSFSVFLLLPSVILSFRVAYRVHQRMMSKIRDEAFLTGLKLQNYSNVPLHS